MVVSPAGATPRARVQLSGWQETCVEHQFMLGGAVCLRAEQRFSQMAVLVDGTVVAVRTEAETGSRARQAAPATETRIGRLRPGQERQLSLLAVPERLSHDS